jgi:addiction module RelE/StbE family toxin
MHKLDIEYAPSFVKQYKKLNPYLKEEVKDKIDFFKNTENHQQLKVHKLHGMKGVYSFYVNYKIRVSFEYSDKNKKIVSLLYVGGHDDAY